MYRRIYERLRERWLGERYEEIADSRLALILERFLARIW